MRIIYNGEKTTKSVVKVESSRLKSFTLANSGSNFSLEGASRWNSKGEKSMISRHWRQSLTNIPSRRGPRCLFTVLDPCPLRAASLSPKIIARHGYRHEIRRRWRWKILEILSWAIEEGGVVAEKEGLARGCDVRFVSLEFALCLTMPRSLVMVFCYPPPSHWRTARSFLFLLASNELPLIDTSRLRAFSDYSDYYKLSYWCFSSLSISGCIILL